MNDLGEWRNWYIEKRLGVQLKYFSLDTQAKLEKEREKLNRWATRLLDVSLAFAAAGFVAMLFNFTSFFGGARLEVILGAAGIMSVVALILVQTFAEVEALNHQIAVCVRQREAIERAQARLYNVNSPELAIALVDEIERQLLQENIDWYFRFEHSQHFCSMRRTPETIEGIRPVSHAWHFRWANAAFARLGVMIQFVLGVVIGRLPWMLFPAAFVALWLGLHLAPEAIKARPEFVNVSGSSSANGCVMIAHGLWGETPDSADETGKPYWTSQMARAFRRGWVRKRRTSWYSTGIWPQRRQRCVDGFQKTI